MLQGIYHVVVIVALMADSVNNCIILSNVCVMVVLDAHDCYSLS